MQKDAVVRLRCTTEEKLAWQQAAAAAGLSLSAWIKGRLQSADRLTDVLYPPVATKPQPVATEAKPVLASVTNADKLPARSDGRCRGGHTVGVKCKLCGHVGKVDAQGNVI